MDGATQVSCSGFGHDRQHVRCMIDQNPSALMFCASPCVSTTIRADLSHDLSHGTFHGPMRWHRRLSFQQ
jgi:hypothetical protein